MKIVDFYKAILSIGFMSADNEGLVSAEIAGSSVPVTVGSKRLVLPNRENLANPNKDGMVLFHPLNENLMRGESEVMVKFRTNVNLRMNYSIGIILQELIGLATSPGITAEPNQLELLALLKDADEKTLVAYQQVLKAMPQGNAEKCFVHFFVKKNAVINEVNHRRGIIVTFPLYQELCNNETGAYGVKLRKKDHASLKAVLEHIFPKIGKKDAYSRGSHSDTAPTLDALLLAVLAVCSNINVLVDDYGNVLDRIKEFHYDDEWVPVLDNLNQFANELRLVPMQNGNEGSVEPKVPQVVSTQLQNVAPPQLMQMPTVQPTQGYAQVQMAPAQQAIPMTSSGKLDWGAVVHSTPGGAGMMPYGPPMLPPGPVSSRMQDPSWARNPGFFQAPVMNQGFNQYGGYPQQQMPQHGYGVRI